MKSARSHRRRSNMLSKIVGTSFAALPLSSSGDVKAQTPSSCFGCKVTTPSQTPIPVWYCSRLWWFEPGGNTSCWIEPNGQCRGSTPPGRTCS